MVDQITEIDNDSEHVEVDGNEHSTIALQLKKFPSKGSYMFMHGAVGGSHPYLILFFKSIGLSVSHGGIIVGFRLLVSAISMHCCSAIGRYTRYNRYWFWFACIFSILTFLPLPWVASSSELSLDSASSDYNCTPLYKEHRTQDVGSSGCNTNETRVYTLFFVMLSMNLGNSAIECIIPGYTNPLVKTVIESQGLTYDMIRNNLYSAVGYGSASFISGVSSDYYKPMSISSYTAIFFVYLAFMILFLITSVFLFEQFTTNPEENEDSYRLLMQACWKVRNVLFLATVITIGMANGILSSFLLAVLDEMNSSRTMMGTSLLVSCITEIFVFAFASRLTSYLRKPLRCICICLFQYFIRFLCISYMTEVWMIIPIQLINIFGFPLFWIAVSDYIRIISPIQTVDSMYSLIHTFYFIVGGVIANILGGVLYGSLQGKVWFRYIAFLYLIWSIIATVFVAVDEKFTQRRELRINSFSSTNDLANHTISEIRDKILLDDDLESNT